MRGNLQSTFIDGFSSSLAFHGKFREDLQGRRCLDVKSKAKGPKKQAFVERIELQPIDLQTTIGNQWSEDAADAEALHALAGGRLSEKARLNKYLVSLCAL